MQTLVAHGARIDAVNDEGVTPLDLAASQQMQVTLMQAAASSPPRPKSSGRKATTQVNSPISHVLPLVAAFESARCM
jgi:ankyrin repeat protein